MSLLTGGARDLPTHQQTLRDAIGWSYDLLSTVEQHLFRRLAVFVGGCIPPAAEEVAGPELGLDVFEGLASLVDKSLLRFDEANDEPRFRMLETIREFALEQLESCGEDATTRDRHATWCMRVAEETNVGSRQFPSVQRTVSAAREHDNLRAGLTYLEQSGQGERFLRMVVELTGFWWVKSFKAEGFGWVERALASAAGAPDHLRGYAMARAAFVAHHLDKSDLGDSYIEQAIPLLRSGGGAREKAHGALAVGAIATGRGEYHEALAPLEYAQREFRELGDLDWSAFLSHFLGINALGLEDKLTARKHLEAALEHELRGESTWSRGLTLEYQGFLAALEGEIGQAASKLQESVAIWLEYGSTDRISDWLMRIVTLQPYLDRNAELARFVGAAEAIRDSLGTIWDLPERTYYERAIQSLREALGEVAYKSARDIGRQLTPSQVCGEGLELLRGLDARPSA